MSIRQTEHTTFIGQHAVVIGASMAGLLSGRVLSDHFERVTIIERDTLPQDVEPRKGVPQGRHGHVLLYKGTTIIDGLFPNLFSTLVEKGSTLLTMEDAGWYHFGVWKGRFPNSIKVYSQSRPFLEQHIRTRLTARTNIRFIDGCEVACLCTNEDQTRVIGVQLHHHKAEQSEEELSADLVVDASGRGSQAPRWLRALGYEQVKETTVKVDAGYASRIYRLSPKHSLNWKLLVINPKPPAEKRAGYMFPIENDCWMVSLASWLRDYPPSDEAGFLEYARSLPVPDLYEAIKDAEPLTPIVTHRFPANQRRHYERMSRLPEGFLILGDAACSFNPIYGQGMTTSALDANALNECLQQQKRLHGPGNVTGLPQRFQKAVAKVIDVPWQLATSEDFRYPETVGHRPVGTSLLNWYTGRVHELVASHPVVNQRFYEVLHMLKPPTALFDPRVLLAVLFMSKNKRKESLVKIELESLRSR